MWHGNSSFNLLSSIYGKPAGPILSLFISLQSAQYGSHYAHSLDKCKLIHIRKEILQFKRPELAA